MELAVFFDVLCDLSFYHLEIVLEVRSEISVCTVDSPAEVHEGHALRELGSIPVEELSQDTVKVQVGALGIGHGVGVRFDKVAFIIELLEGAILEMFLV